MHLKPESMAAGVQVETISLQHRIAELEAALAGLEDEAERIRTDFC